MQPESMELRRIVCEVLPCIYDCQVSGKAGRQLGGGRQLGSGT